MQVNYMRCRSGFTLVELSIVLVILGLLVGGVLAGQSLIRASELRAVMSEIGQFSVATNAFRDKYFVLAGDMNNATSFWGKDNAACSGDSGTAATPGTCNGDGDGRIDNVAVHNVTGESFQFWKQLSLAGLIEGQYSGLSGALGGRDAVIGTNVPKSRFPSGGYMFEYAGTLSGDLVMYDGSYGHIYIFGGDPGISNPTEGRVLKPEELWNIDTKSDDGKPQTGKIRPYYRNGWQSSVCDSSSTNDYNMSDSSAACNMSYITGL